MARNVYVTALEPGSGKSAVVLGLTEVLSRRAGRLGYFRPLIGSARTQDADLDLVLDRFRLPQTYEHSYALTADDLHDVTDRTGYNRLIERVLTGYRTVADGSAGPPGPVAGIGASVAAVADAAATAATDASGSPDVVVGEGSDFTGSRGLDLDLNVDAANHLGAPVLLVVRGRNRTPEQVVDAVGQGISTLRDRGCTLIGVVANRVDPDAVDAVRVGLPEVLDDLVGAVVPEAPMLAEPTVAEVARALDARYLQPADGHDGPTEGSARRQVGRLIVGAMGLEHFLERIVDGDLVITPGDRVDIVAGSLAAHLSGTYPAVAGLVLTGGGEDRGGRRPVRGQRRHSRAGRADRSRPAHPDDAADVRARADRAGEGGPAPRRAARGQRRPRADGRRAAVAPRGRGPHSAGRRARRARPGDGARAGAAGRPDRRPAHVPVPRGVRRHLPRAAQAQGRHAGHGLRPDGRRLVLRHDDDPPRAGGRHGVGRRAHHRAHDPPGVRVHPHRAGPQGRLQRLPHVPGRPRPRLRRLRRGAQPERRAARRHRGVGRRHRGDVRDRAARGDAVVLDGGVGLWRGRRPGPRGHRAGPGAAP